jgi:hypothetical protein
MLAETETNPAIYVLDAPTGYVRARVTNSRGDVAWTQPFFVTAR